MTLSQLLQLIVFLLQLVLEAVNVIHFLLNEVFELCDLRSIVVLIVLII